LGATALATGSYQRALGHGGKIEVLDRDEDVAGVDTRRRGCEYEGRRQVRGEIFEGVDGKMDAALFKSLFNLFGEHSFGTDLGEGYFLQAVAGGLDDFDFYGVALAAE
jgi:hypothetical protein